MSEFRARIGRVKMKEGGADLRIIDGPEHQEGKEARILSAARHVADESEPGSTLEGFVIVAFYSDKCRNVIYELDGDHGLPRELIPAYVTELIRRKIITQAEACDVVNRANGWDEE
jgi:hypothetical protein